MGRWLKGQGSQKTYRGMLDYFLVWRLRQKNNV